MRLLCLIVIVVFVVACKNENKNFHSRFTLVNAVPNSNGFTFKVGTNVIDPNIVYGKPNYEVQTPAATTMIEWLHNGSPLVDSSFLTDIPNGTDFQMIFYDSIGVLKTYLQQDFWKQPASSSTAYIRLMPLVINANNLLVTNDTNKAVLPSTGFGNFFAAGQDFNPVDTTVTKLKLFNSSQLLDSLTGIKLLAGRSYTIYAMGVLGATDDKKPKMIMHLHQ